MRVSVSLPAEGVHADDGGQLDTHQFMDVSDAAYRTAHHYPGGIAALAIRMGVLASTLNSKVSVNNTTHHLTLREAVTMQEVTGDTSILQAMASELGYNCVPALPANTDDPISLHWQMVAAIGELEHALADSFQAGVSRNAMRRCDGLAADAISHINNLLAALRAKVPAPPTSQH